LATPAVSAAPVDSTGTHHATPSVETLELVIGLATSRVLARLPPGRVQPASAGAATGLPEQAAAVLELLLLPQPPAARLTATTRTTPATAGGLTKHLICDISYRVGLRWLP